MENQEIIYLVKSVKYRFELALSEFNENLDEYRLDDTSRTVPEIINHTRNLITRSINYIIKGSFNVENEPVLSTSNEKKLMISALDELLVILKVDIFHDKDLMYFTPLQMIVSKS